MELCNTMLTLGYAPAQNMYHMLDVGNDNNSATDITVAMQIATAATSTGTLKASLLGQGTAASSVHPASEVALCPLLP